MNRRSAEKIFNSGKEPTISKLLEMDKSLRKLQCQVDCLSKNSTNSSKPPSSDIVKPRHHNQTATTTDTAKRKIGGQPGHPLHRRPLFHKSEITSFIDYHLECCPNCSGQLQLRPDQDRILQQVELNENPLKKNQHKAYAYWCEHCKKIHYADFPPPVIKAGLFKEDISATVGFLKFVGAMSLSGIKKYCRDILNITVTKGYLAKIIRKGMLAIRPAYDELLKKLPDQQFLNIDETGHKENGELFWTWIFRAPDFAAFVIDKSRGSQVLIEVLGKEFKGVLGCDYFSAYRKYMKDFNIILQFCLAHLIRDVKYLCDRKDKTVAAHGIKLLDTIKELFKTIHERDSMNSTSFSTELDACSKIIIAVATIDIPDDKDCKNMANRFLKHGNAYFQFITTPGIDPTNNIAEQALRFVVMYRHVSQGTRSEKGRKACECFWSVVATCVIQGRSAFSFIKDAFLAFFNGNEPPSLLPTSLSSP
jgi:thiol-disulfide isomerase/thioredoxin